VYCDHDRNGERVRDWLEGVVVQVDAKMIAVQFKDNVYLTDGWMVPDTCCGVEDFPHSA
jgi:hypothetical protein